MRTFISRLFAICILALILNSCKEKSQLIYHSESYSLYSDKVIQGNYTALVKSPEHIVSDYRSLGYARFPRLITFKFSINEKDNEMLSGSDHHLYLTDSMHVSPVLVFGEQNDPGDIGPETPLPVNFKFTFRLDMRPVLESFHSKGYFEAFDGSRIVPSEFKGVYIAGAVDPLSWDFVNLASKQLALHDDNNDGIFEITLLLNPYNENEEVSREWKLTDPLSDKPRYASDQPLVDALFNLSEEEARKNIEPDSTFRTGSKWAGVWTRDVSYSTILSMAMHEPSVAKISLMKKVKRGRIIQDTGSGGAWPISSDRTVWALAAWEIFKWTGDTIWLHKAYTIIKNTLNDDYKTLPSQLTGMYKGESSFLDWREQTYPRWMNNADIFFSENLGTNVVHYQANRVLTSMATLLGEDTLVPSQRAMILKEAINEKLWLRDRSEYSQYLYGRNFLSISPRFEALGSALAVLYGVADGEMAKGIIRNTPATPFGVPCIYPEIPGIPNYHNNAIWPFVQSFWNLAAARAGNEDALIYGLASIYRAAALFLTNYENMVATNGDYEGTEINSDRMLWSMSGNMAMVYKVFMGITPQVNGLEFHPVIPEVFNGRHELSNLHYRHSILSIQVEGYGNKVNTITLDGKLLDRPFIPADLNGVHEVRIGMSNQPFLRNTGFGIRKVRFSLTNPLVNHDGKILTWEPIQGAKYYFVYRNGDRTDTVHRSGYVPEGTGYSEYSVSAVDSGDIESFQSEPVMVSEPGLLKTIEFEDFLPRSEKPYINFSGRGFVAFTPEENTLVNIPVDAPVDGIYLISCRYSNGSGPWNTSNKCAIRSAWVNDNYIGVWVFPQRGTNEWSDWAWSNGLRVRLLKGPNRISIRLEDWNTNMDGKVNDAMLDCLRLIRLKK